MHVIFFAVLYSRLPLYTQTQSKKIDRAKVYGLKRVYLTLPYKIIITGITSLFYNFYYKYRPVFSEYKIWNPSLRGRRSLTNFAI